MSPGYKAERDFRDIQDEKVNYQRYIEDKYSQLMAEEKARLEHLYKEKCKKFETAFALDADQSQAEQVKKLKHELHEQARVNDQRVYEHEMQKEEGFVRRLAEERRILEAEMAGREEAIEKRMQ